MTKSIEISLKSADNQEVSLNSMSPKALDSFMVVLSSLKSIIMLVNGAENISFQIIEGSARFRCEGALDVIEPIYTELDAAIKGDSYDKELTSLLRKIQEQVKRDSLDYHFIYKEANSPNYVKIHDRLKSSKRIFAKRKKNESEFRLRIITGFLNQIGGSNPNYHFDYGYGDKITIDCTIEQAVEVKKFLYKDVNSLLLVREFSDPNKRNQYFHKVIFENEIHKLFRSYLTEYNKEDDLVKKLSLTHDFVDNAFEYSKYGFEILRILLIAFNDINFHLSELKTVLIISKPFVEIKNIEELRNNLLKTYIEKKK